MHMKDERVLDTSSWSGRNAMGRILMQLRDEFRSECNGMSDLHTSGYSEESSVMFHGPLTAQGEKMEVSSGGGQTVSG